MQEKNLFEYAVVRVVPRVEREEFLNVGVILYCKKQKFLHARILINEQRLCSFCDKIDIAQLKANLDAFMAIADGTSKSSPIARLDLSSRFRWLIAKRSTIVQTSPVHPGLCDDAGAKLEQLFEQLVM